jgi:hypothetical protein
MIAISLNDQILNIEKDEAKQLKMHITTILKFIYAHKQYHELLNYNNLVKIHKQISEQFFEQESITK